MLAVSPLRSDKNEREGFSTMEEIVEFLDFSGGNLFDSIDLDELFVGFSDGGDMPPEMGNTGEFYAISDDSDLKTEASVTVSDLSANQSQKLETRHDKGRKSSSKNPKRKVKVDWTPELHRRFVQAVEQLGVDKAVPSRILEIMGIDCLTRHNIASHLQKYRSHRKHLQTREAEAASWSHKRHMYVSTAAGGGKNPWMTPTMGFPPISQMPHHFRPLHVWGHPSVDQSFLPPPPHGWPPPHALLPPPATDSYWHQNLPTPGTPCFPTQFPPPATTQTRVPPRISTPAAPPNVLPVSNMDPNERIDAAIEDVLSKPWLPLPLGLKPPSMDGVMSELQLQGISNVPPPCA